MKICIWCRRTEEQTSFLKKAHTIPQSLGGIHICTNVCDGCNAYFGSATSGKPSIEAALKEGLNLSRFHILNSVGTVGRGHRAGRYKSTYFDVDFTKEKHELKLKAKYFVLGSFQQTLTRRFKQGLYKVFLEETERQRGVHSTTVTTLFGSLPDTIWEITPCFILREISARCLL
ncbi:HNH endonuclease [Larkinella soli]|uniref:HNH endonuclease n=1 Tax=Larkinella soli TaxID=1770527 RepID=UPI000FFB60A6|nr:HNH endonuclease [Larkinella soli]